MNRHKRPRSTNDETTNRSTSHQEVLDCLLGRLLSLQDDDDDDDGRTQTQRFARLQQDQQLVRSLQESLQLIQQRLHQKKARLHQRYSLLRRLDEGVRKHILEYLDEEGFWVLEESTVMEIDPERAQEKWRQLCRQRSRPFPPLADGHDDDRDRGIRFAKASRMARCLQELATQHYNTGGDNKPTTLLQHSWPTHACETLRTIRAEPLFFVRLVYHPPPHDNHSQAPPVPVVVEGFAQDTVYEIDEEPGRSEIALVLDDAAEAQAVIFESLHRLATAGFGSAEEFHEAELRAKRRIGDRLSLTVLELQATPDFRLRPVVSTSGFSYEDGEFLYLQPRSPDFADRNPSYRGNDCIRVGLELETNDEHRLGISLTG